MAKKLTDNQEEVKEKKAVLKLASLLMEKTETKENLGNIEAIIVLRMLNNLGYIGGSEVMQNLVKSPFEENLILELSKFKDSMNFGFDKVLTE